MYSTVVYDVHVSCEERNVFCATTLKRGDCTFWLRSDIEHGSLDKVLICDVKGRDIRRINVRICCGRSSYSTVEGEWNGN